MPIVPIDKNGKSLLSIASNDDLGARSEPMVKTRTNISLETTEKEFLNADSNSVDDTKKHENSCVCLQ